MAELSESAFKGATLLKGEYKNILVNGKWYIIQS